MIILGINDRVRHNTAAAVVIDGKLVASLEQERISRIKNDNAYPREAIAEVLALAGVGADDVDLVASSNLPFKEQKPYFDRFLQQLARAGKTDPAFRYDALKKRLQRIRRGFQPRQKLPGVLAAKPVESVEHHLAHAASAYYGSPFGNERVGVITLDGVGDYS